MKVQPGTITSSPSPMPRASSASSSVCDPLVTATAGPVPWNSPHADSNSFTLVPCDDHQFPLSRTSRSSSRSRSSATGQGGYGARRTGVPPFTASFDTDDLQADRLFGQRCLPNVGDQGTTIHRRVISSRSAHRTVPAEGAGRRSGPPGSPRQPRDHGAHRCSPPHRERASG